MKQTLLTRLVLGAIAGIAATGAYAGQIQASSVSIAREVVTTDTQTVVAPTISYRFAGDVDPTVQTQVFQVQWTLNSSGGAGADASVIGNVATFDTTVAVSNDAIVVNDGITGLPTANPYTIVAKGYSTDKRTFWATISMTAANPIVKQPIVVLNGAGATTPARYTSLKTGLVGDLVADYANGASGLAVNCARTVKMPVGVRHFVALTNPIAIAGVAGNGTPDEHIRAGNTSDGVTIVFPTNVLATVTPTTQRAVLTAGGNMTFTDIGGAGTSWVNATTVDLGGFALSQAGAGYDSNLTNVYALNTVAANGLRGIAVAATNVGEVETAAINVAVSATQGFVPGGTLYLQTAANGCGAGVLAGSPATAITALNAAGPITAVLTAASINAAALTATGTGAIRVCYGVPGTATIPSSAFSGIVTVAKAAAGANLNEQNNVCGGPLYSLGGGLKIDVRNYASSKETSGYQSVVRIINNSDLRPADVWAQIIHQDGKLGAWGKIADLPVRGSVNMTAAQIEAKLVNAATAAVGPNAAVAQAATATTSDTAPRLRITSTTGASLRVQNYLFNRATSQILEGSGSQGVDYEGNNILRAPVSDGQYISQDANSGLNLGN